MENLSRRMRGMKRVSIYERECASYGPVVGASVIAYPTSIPQHFVHHLFHNAQYFKFWWFRPVQKLMREPMHSAMRLRIQATRFAQWQKASAGSRSLGEVLRRGLTGLDFGPPNPWDQPHRLMEGPSSTAGHADEAWLAEMMETFLTGTRHASTKNEVMGLPPSVWQEK